MSRTGEREVPVFTEAHFETLDDICKACTHTKYKMSSAMAKDIKVVEKLVRRAQKHIRHRRTDQLTMTSFEILRLDRITRAFYATVTRAETQEVSDEANRLGLTLQKMTDLHTIVRYTMQLFIRYGPEGDSALN